KWLKFNALKTLTNSYFTSNFVWLWAYRKNMKVFFKKVLSYLVNIR
ncbi:uncharacterized protein METZ01_LOCUS318218, partial [marine metagenome]